MTHNVAELLVLAVIVILLAPALVYLFGSFYLMAAHVESRPGKHGAAAMLRELYYVLITQPLIPLYYVIGRRLGGGDGVPVIFIHGYFQNRADFWWMARRFRRSSVGPLYGFNYPWFDSVDRNVLRLGRFLDRVRAETGAEQVNLVAHSLGGIVALEYAYASPDSVARCITIGTPHNGVKWRGPIPGRSAEALREGTAFTTERRERTVVSPTLSIYSTHDNIVHPPSTSELSSRGGSDLAIDGLGHLSLLYSPEVAGALIEFIDPETAGGG